MGRITASFDDDGFSLLEMVVVVAVIAVLAGAVKLYKLDNFRYPTTEQGLRALVEAPTASPVPPNYAANGYIDRLPQDPWGNEYQYLQPGVHDEFDIFTLGADGVAGGTGPDADIGSWGE